LGDLQSLQKHGRRAIGLHIEGDVMAALAVLSPKAVSSDGETECNLA